MKILSDQIKQYKTQLINEEKTKAMTLCGGRGYVIRWNDLTGSDEHRFNDVIEACYNKANFGGTGFDADIYGNMLYCSEDDSMEVDSSGRNVRVFDNRFEQYHNGISVAPIVMGPVYLFRNLVVNAGDSQNVSTYVRTLIYKTV